MPVYNAEAYLPRMLDSLLAQTLPDLEVICVDDCSTDGSHEVLQRYAASHPSRFRVIRNRENLGVGLSRNEGIRAASGEYIGFADNDDSTDPDMFRSLYEKAKEGDYDIVRCDVMVHRGEKLETRAYPTNCEDGSAALREEMLRYLLYSKPSDRADSLWPSGVWNKIYKRTLVDREKLFFLSERELPFEDYLFNLKALLATQKVACVRQPFYHHYHYTSSLGCNDYRYKCFRHGIKSIEESRVLLNHYHPEHIHDCRERLA